MNEFTITLTETERIYLAELLESTLKSVHIEEHRTRSPSFREHILADEEIIESLKKKIQSLVPA